MVERLSDDHTNARRLAEGLLEIPGFEIDMNTVQTNMVFFTLAAPLVEHFKRFMAEKGIIIGGGPYPIRAVTHYGIEAADIEYVIQAANECSKQFMN
jgi:threonine aldolase